MGKIHKDFKLHQVFMRNFLWQTEHIYSVCQINSQYMYYSQKYSAHFGLDVLKQFGLRYQNILDPKSTQNNLIKSTVVESEQSWHTFEIEA